MTAPVERPDGVGVVKLRISNHRTEGFATRILIDDEQVTDCTQLRLILVASDLNRVVLTRLVQDIEVHSEYFSGEDVRRLVEGLECHAQRRRCAGCTACSLDEFFR
jgi:hypothetical protein